MAIAAKTSHKLHQILGDEAAEDVMNWMQRADTNRVELRDLNELNYARLDSRFDAFEARFSALETRIGALETRVGALETRVGALETRIGALETRIGALEVRIEARFAALDLTLERRFAEADLKLERRFSDLLKWSFVFWVGAVGAVVLSGALR